MRSSGTSHRPSFVRIAAIGREAVLAGACLIALIGPAQAAPAPRTMAFVITEWDYAILESKFHDECPEGFTIGSSEIWWRGLSKAARAKATNNGNLDAAERYQLSLARGPNKENVCLNPEVIKNDPPMLTVEGKIALGMNMDGTSDGKATSKSCAHQKFTSPDGEPGIDNQMYRLLGCIYGWHKYENLQINSNITRKMTGRGIRLIEVSGVDDARNDPDVTVNFYHALDQYAVDAQSDFVPFASYRINMTKDADGKVRYRGQARGKIVNGVLTTDPADVVLPFFGNQTYMNDRFRDFRIRLAISENGETAKGLAAGYYDAEQVVYYMGGLGEIIYPSEANCPSLLDAARQLADGYPDPKTGKCTMLSSAYTFDAVAAFAIHPDGTEVAQSPTLLHRMLAVFGLEK